MRQSQHFGTKSIATACCWCCCVVFVEFVFKHFSFKLLYGHPAMNSLQRTAVCHALSREGGVCELRVIPQLWMACTYIFQGTALTHLLDAALWLKSKRSLKSRVVVSATAALNDL